MILIRHVFSGVLLLLAMVVFAQVPPDAEAVYQEGDEVFFDYRMHRNPTRVYEDFILKDSSDTVAYTYLFNGNPIVSYRHGKFVNAVHDKVPFLPYRLDVQLQPSYGYRLGPYEHPFQSQIGIAPRIQYNFGKGVYGVFQWIFPLQNDFRGEFAQGHRPGEMGLGYDYIYKGLHAFRAFAGTFRGTVLPQYGFQAEYLGRDQKGVFYYGGAVFYSRSYRYDHMYLYSDTVNTLSGYVQVAYRIPKYDLTVRLIGDVYLNHQKGVTLEVIRQFGNTDIGFFAIAAQSGNNGGFFFRIPLWPRKFYRNDWMQVRLPNTFQFFYNVKSAASMPRARNYNGLFEDVLRFNPNFLNGQMDGSGY